MPFSIPSVISFSAIVITTSLLSKEIENIIPKDKATPNSFKFILETKGLRPKALDDGSIALQDETPGETQLTLPPAYIGTSGMIAEAAAAGVAGGIAVKTVAKGTSKVTPKYILRDGNGTPLPLPRTDGTRIRQIRPVTGSPLHDHFVFNEFGNFVGKWTR